MTTCLPTLERSEALLARTIGHRHGILLSPTVVPRLPADPRGVVHASVAREDDASAGSAGGGVGPNDAAARVAAAAEALERYAAAWSGLDVGPWRCVDPARRIGFDRLTLHHPEQLDDEERAAAGYCEEPDLVPMWRLADGVQFHLPAVLVGLTTQHGTLSTSSGLAASFSLEHALLRGVQELIERDALMATWLHQLPGREVEHRPHVDDVTRLGGWMRAFDITPAWSSHPVAMVLGMMPLDGAPRCSMGVACRSNWADAALKAEQECLQGTVFAGHTLRRRPELRSLEPSDVTDFDRHAVFYTVHPDRFEALPILQSRAAPRPAGAAPASTTTTLRRLVRQLADHGVDLFARDLTTIDLHQIGLRVVRVIAPGLIPIHHDHRRPFLGGTASDVGWRYPGVRPLGEFPSPHPHPLG